MHRHQLGDVHNGNVRNAGAAATWREAVSTTAMTDLR
jgi:hypothetical protein